MGFEKKLAQIISLLFHPLLMPSVGMLIIFNSGTYLSLIPPEAKRVILTITFLSTLVFPLSLLPVLYFRKLISDLQIDKREERFLPFLLILILYILTFIFILRLPLHSHIHGYALTLPVMVALLMIVNIKYKISTHMLGIGGITGLIISLILIFGVPLQAYFMLTILAAGLVGTSRKFLGDYSSLELFGGFVLGMITTGSVMIIY
jgi:hypothetical protein